jgi:DNA-binding transcriptional MerR regulator
MAPKVKTLSLAEIAEEFGVTTRTIQNWREAGMPTRVISGAPRFVLKECIRWRREIDVAEAKEAATPGLGELDDAEERVGLTRARRLMSEHELEILKDLHTPKAETQALMDELVGGFAAVASGRLRRFERDIVAANTPGDARRLTQEIHRALMDGGREFREQIEAEAAQLEADAETEEAA